MMKPPLYSTHLPLWLCQCCCCIFTIMSLKSVVHNCYYVHCINWCFVGSGKLLANDSVGAAVPDSICSQRSVGISSVCTLIVYVYCSCTASYMSVTVCMALAVVAAAVLLVWYQSCWWVLNYWGSKIDSVKYTTHCWQCFVSCIFVLLMWCNSV